MPRKPSIKGTLEEKLRREARERRKRERRYIERQRTRSFALSSPVMTARDAAVYCHVSYSYITKQLAAYGKAKYRGEGTYVPPADGLDLMKADPEKIGHGWFFLREDLDRVLGVGGA